MPITKVTARALRVPVKQATRISTRLLDKRDYLLVTVEVDDSDEVGIGYAYAGTTGGTLLRESVNGLLGAKLVGENPDDIYGLWRRLYQETLLTGRRGAVIRGLSAIDMALWDLSAKRRKAPLAVLLGGAVGGVPAYASGGYYRPDDGGWNDAVAKEIAFNRQLGFNSHKIKVGGLSVREDAARVAAAIAAMGPEGRLALDANNAYRTVPEALQAIRAFERAAGEVGLWWVEEPLSPDDIEGHRAIAATIETPLATGEIHQTRWEFPQLIERHAADILQPDVGVIGGVSEWISVARAAEMFGLPVAPHWHANVHVHLAAATPNCVSVEHFALEKDIYNFELLVTEDTRLVAKNGQVFVPDRPGIGITLDPARLEEYALTDGGHAP
jgi:L-alanine-DL-glutamate epimerase-like enolase superfamily enzyme